MVILEYISVLTDRMAAKPQSMRYTIGSDNRRRRGDQYLNNVDKGQISRVLDLLSRLLIKSRVSGIQVRPRTRDRWRWRGAIRLEQSRIQSATSMGSYEDGA